MGFSTKKIIRTLSSADIVFYGMPALILLLIAGTIAQKWIGLYRAHDMFFGSFYFWVGPVPLPGGFTILGILTLNLIIKFLFASEWHWRKSGIILSHLGVIILLLGGLITALTQKEGFMLLPEGSDPSPYVYDYNQRELYIFKNDTLINRIPFKDLSAPLQITLPFSITITKTCKNCEITATDKTNKTRNAMAQFMTLKPKPEETTPETNFSGATFEISNAQNNQNGTYIAFESMPKPVTIQHNDQTYKIMLGKQQRRLPFTISLIDFVKKTYPGTNKAQSYHSDVTITDGDVEWPVRIEMNKPLRYKGFTFFQSAFQEGEVQASTLAVVENKGFVFPYIGSLIIGLGLLLHCLIRLKGNSRGNISS